VKYFHAIRSADERLEQALLAGTIRPYGSRMAIINQGPATPVLLYLAVSLSLSLRLVKDTSKLDGLIK
jgi:hypothetical protein